MGQAAMDVAWRQKSCGVFTSIDRKNRRTLMHALFPESRQTTLPGNS